MPQPIPTNINAFYADLTEAKKQEAVAHQEVIRLEEYITAQGHPLPLEDGSIPEKDEEDTASSDDVSAAEQKPLDKMNRDELDSYASAHGIQNPAQYDTKKDLIDAIERGQ